MLITICNLSYYNLYHIIMCFVKINHQSINQCEIPEFWYSLKFWWKRNTLLYLKSLNFGMVAVKFWWKRNTLLYVKSLNFGMVAVKFWWKRKTFLYAKSLNFGMVTVKGSDHLAHSWGGLGRFLGSQWDRQLKFSAYASFLISWSLSKFELI